MSAFAADRARLWGVNELVSGVQLTDTKQLETNLADLVRRHATTQPEGVALVQPRPVRRTVTWAELDRRIDAVAAGLSAHGLVAGHRIALVGPNSIEFVIAYLATLRAGYVAVPINPESAVTELGSMIDDCGARVLFTAVAQPALEEDVRQIALTVDGLDELAHVASQPVSSPRDPEALAVLLYTAGTSGEPKAAMLSHRAAYWSRLNQRNALRLGGCVSPDKISEVGLQLFGVGQLDPTDQLVHALESGTIGSKGRHMVMT